MMSTHAVTRATVKARALPFGFRQLVGGVPGALRKLDPRLMWRNPVMLIVETGAALTALLGIAVGLTGAASEASLPFIWGISAWLWGTVIVRESGGIGSGGSGKGTGGQPPRNPHRHHRPPPGRLPGLGPARVNRSSR